MSAANNSGREVAASAHDNGGMILEVWATDERGRRTESIICCIVEEHETPAAAVAGLLAEFLHPFGAAWESPEQYGKELDAVKWLAEFYGIKPEDVK